jgi:hypothetical protein
LLGTLLVGILVAHRRHAEQIRRATVTHDAIEAADKLLCQWHEQGILGPATAAGCIEGRDDLVWTWSVSAKAELRHVGAAIGRLEVFRTSDRDEPLAQVELVTTASSAIQPRTQMTSR